MICSGVASWCSAPLVGIADAARRRTRPARDLAPQMIMSFGNGFMLPDAIAGAVSVRPQAAGTAAGIIGFTQMAAWRGDGAAHRPCCSPAPQTALPMPLIDAGAVRLRAGGVLRAGRRAGA